MSKKTKTAYQTIGFWESALVNKNWTQILNITSV